MPPDEGLAPEPGWKDVWPFPFSMARRSFAGPIGMAGVSLRYFLKPDGSLAAKVRFDAQAEGAPGRAHGGALLTVLDEAMGAAAWTAGLPVLTARLDTSFRRGAPLGEPLVIETRLAQRGGRTVRVLGAILDREGRRVAEAEGVFARLSKEQQAAVFGQ